MKIFFLRLFFIFTLLFLEFSFFDVLFPWISAPIIIIISIIAWSLLLPFPRVLFVTISLTALFDIISSGNPGIFTLYTMLLVYVISFISRRLLIEQYGRGIIVYALFSALSVLGWSIFEFIFSRGDVSFWTGNTFSLFFSIVPSFNLFLSMFFCIPLFIVAYFSISRFEKYIHSIAQGEVLKIR